MAVQGSLGAPCGDGTACLFCIDSPRCYNWEKPGKGHMKQLYVNLCTSQSKHFNLNKGIGILCSVF